MRQSTMVLLATLLAANAQQGSARTTSTSSIQAAAPDNRVVRADPAGSFSIVMQSPPPLADRAIAKPATRQERLIGRYVGSNVAIDAVLFGQSGLLPEIQP